MQRVQVEKVINVTEDSESLAKQVLTDEAFAKRIDSLIKVVNKTFSMVNEGKLKVSVSLNRKIIAPEEEEVQK